jgi:GTPase SAR1 family protein
MTLEFSTPKIDTIKIMIFGEGGLGKTSLALTSFNPLLLDFNNGVHRASYPLQPISFRGTSAKANWNKVQRTIQSTQEIEAFNTIVIDTYGDVLDLIIDYLYDLKPKLFMSEGKPKENGWGEIKAVSQRFMKTIKRLNKDVVVIAHNNYVKKNKADEYKSYPDIVGSSKKIFERDFDLIGYITLKENKRTLCFDHSEEAMGKNSIELPEYTIPDHQSDQYPTFMAEVIEDVKKRFKTRLEDNSSPLEIFRSIKMEIEAAHQPHELDKVLDKINEVKYEYTVRMLKHTLNNRASALQIKYNSSLPGFELEDKQNSTAKAVQKAKDKADNSAVEVVQHIIKKN